MCTDMKARRASAAVFTPEPRQTCSCQRKQRAATGRREREIRTGCEVRGGTPRSVSHVTPLNMTQPDIYIFTGCLNEGLAKESQVFQRFCQIPEGVNLIFHLCDLLFAPLLRRLASVRLTSAANRWGRVRDRKEE